jgi:hypothetical protein
MPTDKERADMLFQLCEVLFMRTCVLQALLDESGLVDWPRRLDISLNSEQASLLRAEFHEMYEQSLQQADQAALQELLRKIRTSGRIQ